MKKKLFISIMIVTLIVSVSCNRANEKPDLDDSSNKESSIFEAADVEQVRVTATALNIRAGRGVDFPVVGILEKGTTVTVIGKLKDWYVIHLPNDLVGCVYSGHVEPIVIEDENRQIQDAYRVTSDEERLVTLINQERTQRDLSPLQIDLELTRVARIKSQDMIDNNYFSHYSPTYGSPFDMMKNFGIKYVYAGENLAGNPSIENAHESLMDSQGHRENILNPNFTHVGIGVKSGGTYGNMVTQMFISKPK